jgi:hypothetical protein
MWVGFKVLYILILFAIIGHMLCFLLKTPANGLVSPIWFVLGMGFQHVIDYYYGKNNNDY